MKILVEELYVESLTDENLPVVLTLALTYSCYYLQQVPLHCNIWFEFVCIHSRIDTCCGTESMSKTTHATWYIFVPVCASFNAREFSSLFVDGSFLEECSLRSAYNWYHSLPSLGLHQSHEKRPPALFQSRAMFLRQHRTTCHHRKSTCSLVRIGIFPLPSTFILHLFCNLVNCVWPGARAPKLDGRSRFATISRFQSN